MKYRDFLFAAAVTAIAVPGLAQTAQTTPPQGEAVDCSLEANKALDECLLLPAGLDGVPNFASVVAPVIGGILGLGALAGAGGGGNTTGTTSTTGTN